MINCDGNIFRVLFYLILAKKIVNGKKGAKLSYSYAGSCVYRDLFLLENVILPDKEKPAQALPGPAGGASAAVQELAPLLRPVPTLLGHAVLQPLPGVYSHEGLLHHRVHYLAHPP